MSFPKIGLAHDPILYKKLKDTSSHDVLNSYGWVFQISDYTGKIEISKKNWTSFPVIGLAHDQKIEISKKMDDLSRNRSESTVVDSPP